MKTMILNSKMKHKSKTMLEVIRNLVLNFILFFVTAYMRKYPIHIISPKCTTHNTLSLEEIGKKYFMKNSLQQ